ncbi:MAG: pantoate--beta-alanine ligase [Chthoniobacterales bacterium]
MKIVTRVQDVPKSAWRRVLVPTMGALHRGHLELISAARTAAGGDGEVAVSIFVNPLQFAPGSDYEKYPRPHQQDEQLCRNAGVDLLFLPAADEIYAANESTRVDEIALSQVLEGKSRPGHFQGVCTVVTKLFNIIAPDAAMFGEKDFQQLAIIRRMVRDLQFRIEIIAVPTVREADGLACSSRNQYLSTAEREQATVLPKALQAAREMQRSAAEILARVHAIISEAPLARIDYVALVNADTLEPVDWAERDSVLAVAVYFGTTRLIDNIRLS